jgi:hypothetical protein
MHQRIALGDGVEIRVFLVEDLARMRGLLDDLFASLGGIRVVAVATTRSCRNGKNRIRPLAVLIQIMSRQAE